MKNSYSVTQEKLSATLVLEILKDDQRQGASFDIDIDGDMELTFDSTIDDWRDACDLVSWRPLSKALNSWFDIEYTQSEWRDILEPSSQTILLDLCTFISVKAYRNEIKPLNIFGLNCKTAGSFISIRKSLRDIGISTEDIKPSTPIRPYLFKYGGDFIQAIGKLAPNILPTIEIEVSLIQRFSHLMLLAGIVLGIINMFFEIELISTVAFSLGFLGFLAIIVTYNMDPKDIRLGELKTFGDLSTLISSSTDNMITFSR